MHTEPTKTPSDIDSYLLTAMTLAGGLATETTETDSYIALSKEKTEGYTDYTSQLTAFAANIENAYEKVDAQHNGVYMEMLHDKNVLHCYDLDLLPMLMQHAVECNQVVLSEGAIIEYLNSLLEDQVKH